MKRPPLSFFPVCSALLLAAPSFAAVKDIAWREEAPVPAKAADVCPLENLDAHFWDYLENKEEPVVGENWPYLKEADRITVIRNNCAEAERIRGVYLNAKIRLDGALRIVRGDSTSLPDKMQAAKEALEETSGAETLVVKRLGQGSTLVMLLSDTRRILEIERSNLKTVQTGEGRSAALQNRGDLAQARAIQDAGGDLARAEAAGRRLFSNENGTGLPGAVIVGRGRGAEVAKGETAGGALRGRGNGLNWSDRQKEFAEDISNSFKGKGKKEPPPAPKPKTAEKIEGYNTAESRYIQKKKEDAWFGFGWFAERRAKQDVDRVRGNIKFCSEEPAKCARFQSYCGKPDEPSYCYTTHVREEIYP